MRAGSRSILVCALINLLVATAATAFAANTQGITDQSFDHDPGWEGFNNRVKPNIVPTVVQDFGYSRTTFASQVPGEIGGRITRAAEPAWYAAKIAPKTLDDKMSASGAFALERNGSKRGAVAFGWFNGIQRAGMGRPADSLTMVLTASSDGGRLSVFLINTQNQATGTPVTRYERYRTLEEKAEKRPTPIRIDGTRYHWQMDYDPAANAGNGQFHFRVSSDSDKPGDFENKLFTVDLPEGFKRQGSRFDHFGLINITRPGGWTTAYFGDVTLDGHRLYLSSDPHWDGFGNRTSYQPKEIAGCQDFGYSTTLHAGRGTGEIGGLIWRAPYSFYADRIGPLSLADRLEAHGRFMLESGAPDSEVKFGWFNGAVRTADEKEPLKGQNFIAISVGGPTRIGHYFVPAYAIAERAHGAPKRGPVLTLGKAYDWSFVYDPDANGSAGQIRMTLGSDSVTVDLKPGVKSTGAVFDRFGIFTSGVGGGQLKIWLDDLHYTSSRPK
jgi:hypothetical protein